MLTEFKTGDKIRHIAVVKLFKAGSTSTGGVFARGALQDKSGVMNFITFDRETCEYLKSLGCPCPAMVFGTVQYDKFANDGTLQIMLEKAEDIAPDDDLSHLLPSSPKNMDEYKDMLAALILDVRKPHLKALLEQVIAGNVYDSFIKNPAAMKYHHAYIGGLLEHSVDVARLALAMALETGIGDIDLVITGALLHDIGKIKEISPEPGFEYTDTGRLIGHLALGALIVEKAMDALPGFPQDDALDLLHILLSHHGTQEKGSPVASATPESFLVHYADELNASLVQFRTEATDGKEKVDWEYNKMLGRQIRKRG